MEAMYDDDDQPVGESSQAVGESSQAVGESSRSANHNGIEDYDDDYDFSEDEEFPLEDDIDNFSENEEEQPAPETSSQEQVTDQEQPAPETSSQEQVAVQEQQPQPEGPSQDLLEPAASVDDPPQFTYKVTPHGIHYDTVDRLSDETYDVQHRYHFPPLIPRDHEDRTDYPHRLDWDYWYCGPPGPSSLRHAQSTEPEEETPLFATPEEITASAETPVAPVQENPTDAIAGEITASAENPIAPADEILAVPTAESPLDTEFDHQPNEGTISLSLSSHTATPNHASPQTVNTESAVIIGGEETVNTENPIVEERPPTFRSLFFVRVIAVLDNARKVADATLELIR